MIIDLTSTDTELQINACQEPQSMTLEEAEYIDMLVDTLISLLVPLVEENVREEFDIFS